MGCARPFHVISPPPFTTISQRFPGPGRALSQPASLLAAALVLLAALCWVCFFNGLAILYPADKTEALQLELARQMAVSGDWVVPAIDGLPYFDKPPLPYWIGGLLLRLAPQQVWLPRLGTAFSGCIGVIATLALCRFGSPDGASRRGLFRAVSAAAILALMPVYIVLARVAIHDIYLTASTTVALACVVLLSQARNPSRRRQVLSGVLVGSALGVGLLAKGLLSLALPGAIAGLFLLLAGAAARRSLGGRRFLLPLLLALLLVALPWHLAAWHSQGAAFLEGYLGRTHLNRFTSALDGHAGPWFYYLPVYAAITLPWGITALAALVQAGCPTPATGAARPSGIPWPCSARSGSWSPWGCSAWPPPSCPTTSSRRCRPRRSPLPASSGRRSPRHHPSGWQSGWGQSGSAGCC